MDNKNTEEYLVEVALGANVVVGLTILGAATIIGGISYGVIKLGKKLKSVKSKIKKEDFKDEVLIEED